jgi:tryptophanyl-tRNA synthetase
MAALLTDKAEIDRVLEAGAEKARAIAMPILAETRKAAGFL